MTPAPKSWPKPGDPRHETAVEAATEAVKAGRSYAASIPGEKYLFIAPEDEAHDVVAAYHAKLAEQSVVLVDAREVAEWLDDQCGSARAHWFLARFGGGDG